MNGCSQDELDVAEAKGGKKVTEDFEEKIRAVQRPEFYGKNYFDEPKDVYTESGYDRYSPNDSGIRLAAWVILQYLAPRRVLDVGCAKGFMVQILRHNGVDAWGVDVSRYAISTAPESVKQFLRVGSVLDLEFEDNSFDLVVCIETLEHLHPDKVSNAVGELCRVTSDKLFLSIPCVGHNEFGPPHGGLAGKVKPSAMELHEHTESLRGPIPMGDLPTDKRGFPLQGHLTVASFPWWTSIFAKHGCSRRGDIETSINRNEPLISTTLSNVLVFQKSCEASRRDTEKHGPAEEIKNNLRERRRLFLHSSVGKTIEDPRAEGGVALRVLPSDGAGPTLWGPYLSLPQGEWTVTFRLRLGHSGRTGPWLLRLTHRAIYWLHRWLAPSDVEVATIDVSSGGGCKVHASRTIRKSDFRTLYSWQPFPITFLSHGEQDFEFRVHSLGQESFFLDPYTPYTCRRRL